MAEVAGTIRRRIWKYAGRATLGVILAAWKFGLKRKFGRKKAVTGAKRRRA